MLTGPQQKRVDQLRRKGNPDLRLEEPNEGSGPITIWLLFPRLKIRFDVEGKPLDQGIPYRD